MKSGIITKVAGPLVIAEGMRDADMFDVVRVSSQRLIGEIIEMHGDRASIQVYEETSGLGPGEIVESTGAPLSVELGPGLIGSIYDGIQRPLNEIMKVAGTNLKRGVDVPSLDHKKKWHFTPLVKKGNTVAAGDTLGTVQETHAVLHKILFRTRRAVSLKASARAILQLTKQLPFSKQTRAMLRLICVQNGLFVWADRTKESSPPTFFLPQVKDLSTHSFRLQRAV